MLIDLHLLSELHDDGLGSLVELVLGVLLLLLQRGHNVGLRTPLPVVQAVDLMTNNKTVRKQEEEVRKEETGGGGQGTDLVEGDDEGTLLLLQQVDGLERLRLQAVHDVHHQDGDVAQRAAAVPQVTEHTGERFKDDLLPITLIELIDLKKRLTGCVWVT